MEMNFEGMAEGEAPIAPGGKGAEKILGGLEQHEVSLGKGKSTGRVSSNCVRETASENKHETY